MPFEYGGGILECCGLSGIYGLTKDNIAALAKQAERSFEMPGEEVEHDCGDPDCENAGRMEYDEGSGPGICIATTNESQEENGIGDELKKYKFVPVLNTLNPNSGNRITLWVKDLSEGKVSQEQMAGMPPPLLAELKAYVEANPNPKSAAAKALVEKYKEFFSS